jgi:hypothetical protein
MKECYFNQCQHHHKDEPFCKVDTCLVSEEQFTNWRLQAEIERLRSRFTKLDMPRYSGAPMLDEVLAQPNDEFRVWAYTLPPEYWARYDLSAARIGWEGAKGTLKGSKQ